MSFPNYSLHRSGNSEFGNFGIFSDVNNKPLCVTVENNADKIPAGRWHFSRYMSPTKGQVWMADDIPARSNIELHNANFAVQLKGCIAVGQCFFFTDGLIGVSNSVDTLNMLRLILPTDFTITIIEG